MTTPILIQNVV